MPCKTLLCEFCNQPFRKDRYGVHVKAKHVKDLAKQFLDQCDAPLFNPIKSITKGYKPENIPVYSVRNEHDCFYFGVVPQYFEKQDSYGAYIQSEENMKRHQEFLVEVINSIPLRDFLARKKTYQETTSSGVEPPVPNLRLGGLTQPTLFRFESLASQK